MLVYGILGGLEITLPVMQLWPFSRHDIIVLNPLPSFFPPFLPFHPLPPPLTHPSANRFMYVVLQLL